MSFDPLHGNGDAAMVRRGAPYAGHGEIFAIRLDRPATQGSGAVIHRFVQSSSTPDVDNAQRAVAAGRFARLRADGTGNRVVRTIPGA